MRETIRLASCVAAKIRQRSGITPGRPAWRAGARTPWRSAFQPRSIRNRPWHTQLPRKNARDQTSRPECFDANLLKKFAAIIPRPAEQSNSDLHAFDCILHSSYIFDYLQITRKEFRIFEDPAHGVLIFVVLAPLFLAHGWPSFLAVIAVP